jgi:hypothetical protein
MPPLKAEVSNPIPLIEGGTEIFKMVDHDEFEGTNLDWQVWQHEKIEVKK